MRREGLCPSLITTWRPQRDRGALAALPVRHGPEPEHSDAAVVTAEHAQLVEELATARKVIRVPEELAALLELSQWSEV
jgi:transposase